MFRVGKEYVLIHLTELEDGDYLITLAPGSTNVLKVSFNGADLEEIPEFILSVNPEKAVP